MMKRLLTLALTTTFAAALGGCDSELAPIDEARGAGDALLPKQDIQHDQEVQVDAP